MKKRGGQPHGKTKAETLAQIAMVEKAERKQKLKGKLDKNELDR